MRKQKVEACPISYTQVDKHLIKAYSSTVLLVLVASLIFNIHLGLYLISVDFIIRVFIGIKYSPLCTLLTRMLSITPLKPLLVNAGTKKIAAQVGLVFSVLINISYFLGWVIAAKLLSLMFVAAISIDLIFDYCLACKLQSFYLKYFGKK